MLEETTESKLTTRRFRSKTTDYREDLSKSQRQTNNQETLVSLKLRTLIRSADRHQHLPSVKPLKDKTIYYKELEEVKSAANHYEELNRQMKTKIINLLVALPSRRAIRRSTKSVPKP